MKALVTDIVTCIHHHDYPGQWRHFVPSDATDGHTVMMYAQGLVGTMKPHTVKIFNVNHVSGLTLSIDGAIVNLTWWERRKLRGAVNHWFKVTPMSLMP